MNRFVDREDCYAILQGVGFLLYVPASMALLSTIVCFMSGDSRSAPAFIATAALFLSCATVFRKAFFVDRPLALAHAMSVAALGWLLIPCLGALPFFLVAYLYRDIQAFQVTEFLLPINALFESYSGFTGTGLTVSISPQLLPPSLQWWRSFTQWVGGLGVVVVMLALFQPGKGSFQLYYSEAREEKIFPSLRHTVQTMCWLYGAYTIAAVAVLYFLGLNFWESLQHGLTAISTGGFSITKFSAETYPPTIKVALCIIMIIGAISFSNHYALISKRESSHWRQGRAMFSCLVVIGTLLLIETSIATRNADAVDSIFQVVSALCTAGFQSDNIVAWSRPALLLLIFAMLIGGQSGSTAGGIKLVRLVILGAAIRWKFAQIRSSPSEIVRFRIGEVSLSEQEAAQLVQKTALLVLTWITTLALSVFLLSYLLPEETPLEVIIFESTSALANVGLSVGLLTEDLSSGSKALFILLMWIGRLEIVPVLLILSIPLSVSLEGKYPRKKVTDSSKIESA